jgi:ATP-binding cassette subfamily B protein
MKLAGMRTTQSFVREQENYNIFYETNEDIKASWMKAVRVDRLFWPALDMFSMISTVLVYISGVAMMGAGGLQLPSDFDHQLSGPLLGSAQQHGDVLQPAAYGNGFLERIFEIMDTPAQIQSLPDAPDLPPIQGEVTFDHVYFSYDEEKEILQTSNLSFVQARQSLWSARRAPASLRWST